MEKYEYVAVKITAGKLLLKTGEIVDGFGRGGATAIEDLIPVTEGETIEIKTGGIWGGTEGITGTPVVALWFDENKNFVSVALENKNYNWIEKVVPSGVSYIAISYWNGIECEMRRKKEITQVDDSYKNIVLELMKKEQEIQHNIIRPYYKTPTQPMLTFGQDDMVRDVPEIAKTFIQAGVPMFSAYVGNGNFCFTGDSVDESFWGKSAVTVRDVINKIVENGGEVLSHHGIRMDQEMLEDFDTCYDHFVKIKKSIEDEGWECNGIILAGGVGQVVGSPISDMWVRSNFLYSDIYGEAKYKEPYFHYRTALSNIKTADKLKEVVQEAIDKKEWKIFYLHNFTEFPKEELEEFLSWMKEKDYIKYCKTYKQVYDELISYEIKGLKVDHPAPPDLSVYYTKEEIDNMFANMGVEMLTSITATKTKVSYAENTEISTSDVVVTANYTTGESRIVTGFTTNVSYIDTSFKGEKKLIISYTDSGITKTAVIKINVVDPSDMWDCEGTFEFTNNVDAIGIGEEYTFERGKQYTISFEYDFFIRDMENFKALSMTFGDWRTNLGGSMYMYVQNKHYTGKVSKTITCAGGIKRSPIWLNDGGDKSLVGFVDYKFRNIEVIPS